MLRSEIAKQNDIEDAFLGEVKARKIVLRVVNLPTIPAVVGKLLQIIDDPRTTHADLSNLISQDQVLASKLLKLANSSFYGFSGRVRTIKHAAVLLGFDDLKNLALGVSVIEKFSGNWKSCFDFDEFWGHAIGCSIAAKMIARQANPAKAGEAFVAGLIHDIGKHVLSQFATDHFEAVVDQIQLSNESWHWVEKQILGVSHAEVGGWFAERWNFPAQLVDAIANHHTPQEARRDPCLAAIVHFADYLTRKFGIGFAPEQHMPDLHLEALDHLVVRSTEEGLIDYPYYEKMIRKAIDEGQHILELFKRT